MKKVVLCLILNVFFFSAIAQRVVYNYSLDDIDDANNFMDTATVCHGYHTLDLFSCQGSQFNDSCFHLARQEYDSVGRLIQMVKGDDLANKKIDYWIQYKKITDSSYETLVKYPPSSTMISNLFFLDTVINNKYQHFSLYKKDKAGNVVVRSLYYVDKHNEVKIERYDLDNKLQQIFYPIGRGEYNAEWTDSIVTNLGKTVTYHNVFPKSEYTSSTVYDKDGRVLETFYINKGFADLKEDVSKTLFIYDTAGNTIKKIALDGNNRFISEERFYYNSKNIVRYTMDYDLLDNDVNEEQIWNNNGSLILIRSRPLYSKTEIVWKYFFRNDGLRERAELYKDGQHKATKVYKYK